MLSNNICDLEKDVIVKRHTLPYYIGVKPAVRLFAWTYYVTYAATVIMVVSGMLHPFALVSLLTFFIVHKNVKEFAKKQDKATTFLVSIKNYVIIMGANTLAIFISGFMQG
jgi:1,4-dihydroxy-2-naphthoate octaprenyltransferase